MLDGRVLGHGLPEGPVSVIELQRLLPGLDPTGRDEVWRYLVRLARSGPEVWVVVCCGLALPGLRTAAAQATIGYSGSTDDLDAEVLAGFVEALGFGVLPERGICGSLWRAAYNAARRARRAEARYVSRRHPCDLLARTSPRVPVGHPDVLVGRAVVEGQISRAQAELIGLVCLEGVSLRRAAAMLGLSFGTAQRRLTTAKTALARWLGSLTDSSAEYSRGSCG
jgi:DNA-directed RNA polymerase specialized sigma24 family protein